MTWLILLMGSFLAAMVSGAAGFGGSLLLLPVASACLGADMAVPVLTVAQLLGNLSRMLFGWREIDWKSVGLFSLTALPLAALGAFGFTLLPKSMVTRVVGGGLILLTLLKLCRKWSLPAGKSTLLIGGGLTGGLSGLCGSGGPIGAAVFLSLGLSPTGYIASEAATACAMHLLKSFIYAKYAGLTLPALLTGLAMGASMALGTAVAHRFIRRMNKNRFQRYTAILLCLMGAYMLIFGAS